MNIDNDSYKLAVKLREVHKKMTHSFHSVGPTMQRAIKYAEDNRISPGILMDMMVIEFLQRRSISLEDIPEIKVSSLE